jgi:predicted membrane channel-forming protein YqfA (hemolysin III family)
MEERHYITFHVRRQKKRASQTTFFRSLMSGQLLAVNLAALTSSSLFYGMFVVLFSTSMYLLVGRYLATRQSRASHQESIFRSTVFIAAICLFCAVTAVRLSLLVNPEVD